MKVRAACRAALLFWIQTLRSLQHYQAYPDQSGAHQGYTKGTGIYLKFPKHRTKSKCWGADRDKVSYQAGEYSGLNDADTDQDITCAVD